MTLSKQGYFMANEQLGKGQLRIYVAGNAAWCSMQALLEKKSGDIKLPEKSECKTCFQLATQPQQQQQQQQHF